MIAGRDTFVQDHLPFVRSVVAKVARGLPRNIEFDDLLSYGVQGLLEAKGRFDPLRGQEFTTFAYYRVRGAVYDGLRSMGYLSRREYDRVKAQAGANAYLQGLADKDDPQTPKSLEDKAQEVGQAIEGLVAIFVTSLEGLMEGKRAFQPSNQDKLPDEAVTAADLAGKVREALDALPDQERAMLRHVYYDDLNIKEAGERLGITKSWASRLHGRAIDSLARGLRRTMEGQVPIRGQPEGAFDRYGLKP